MNTTLSTATGRRKGCRSPRLAKIGTMNNTPTTVLGAIAMAGGHVTGANLRQVVVFRRGDDWRLMATMLDVNGALYGRRPTPADEIWINDADVIVVPKTPIQMADEVIDQFFTRGVYSLFPQFVFGQFGFDNFRSISVP